MPLLGICRGAQALNVARGGTLHQHVAGHRQNEPGCQVTHEVEVLDGSHLAGLIGAGTHAVNSFHHQAVDRLGDGLEVEAWCQTDDIIEQMRLRDYPFALAVQYHPERGEGYEALFADFVSHLDGR